MPSKKKPAAAGMTALPSIPNELIEQLTGGATPMTADQINATTMALKKALIERALGAELSHHLGYALGSTRPEEAANQRLSEARAQAVADYLVGHGIAADRITVPGRGETAPAHPNDGDENRAKNRRVVIEFRQK